MNNSITVNTDSYKDNRTDIIFLLKFTFAILTLILLTAAFCGSYQNIKNNFSFNEYPIVSITSKIDLYKLTHTTDSKKIDKILNKYSSNDTFLSYVAKIGNSTIKKHLLNLDHLSSDVIVEICNNLTSSETENIEFRKSLLSIFNTATLNRKSETDIINLDKNFFDFCLLKSNDFSTSGLINLLENRSSINLEFSKSDYMQTLIISHLEKVNLNNDIISSISSYELPTVNAYIEETYPTNTM